MLRRRHAESPPRPMRLSRWPASFCGRAGGGTCETKIVDCNRTAQHNSIELQGFTLGQAGAERRPKRSDPCGFLVAVGNCQEERLGFHGRVADDAFAVS